MYKQNTNVLFYFLLWIDHSIQSLISFQYNFFLIKSPDVKGLSVWSLYLKIYLNSCDKWFNEEIQACAWKWDISFMTCVA